MEGQKPEKRKTRSRSSARTKAAAKKPEKEKEEEELPENQRIVDVSRPERSQPIPCPDRKTFYWGTLSNGRRISVRAHNPSEAYASLEEWARNPVVGGVGVEVLKIQ